MSSLHLLFYGKLVDLLGREVNIECGSTAETVAMVRERLAELYPNARSELLKPTLRACIGDVLVDDEFAVQPGVTIEFFPPVSGG
jgi:molybdopterin converting factor small subunit